MRRAQRYHAILAAGLATSLGLVACISEISLDDRECPCIDGWSCVNNVCVEGDPAASGTTTGGPAPIGCEPACGEGYRCADAVCAPRVQLRGATSLPTSDRDSLSLAIPQGASPGDVLLFVAYAHSITNATFPPGWEAVATNAGSCGGWRTFHATKVYGPDDVSPVIVSLGSTESTAAVLVAYGGTDGAAPIEAQSGVALSDGPLYSDTPWTTGDITTFSPAAMVVAVFTDQDGGPWAAPPGMTKEVDVGRVVIFDALQPVPGPTGAKQATGGNAGCGTAGLWAFAPGAD